MQRAKNNVPDLAVFAGYILIVCGCWLLSPALALIVAGWLLLAAGLAGHFRRSAAEPPPTPPASKLP